MSFLKNILGRFFAFWAMLVFVVTLFLVAIPLLVSRLWPEPKRSAVSHSIYCVWMGVFLALCGIRKKVRGRNQFRKGQNYVVVFNHRSLLDPPLSTPAIPGPNKTIAKAEMARIPIFGLAYKGGSVLVDRKSEESRRASYGKMKHVLEQGMHMCIYPEGTRNKTREPLQRFQDGAFRLAKDTGKPIIPALLFNTDKAMPRKPFFFWPQKIEVHFLPEIDGSDKTVQQLKEEAFTAMQNHYVANKK